MSNPVFLYNDPHPVHEKMATEIDAEFVECAKGGVLDRMNAGLSHDFGERPLLIEGGVPLFEAGFIGLSNDSGPIIELAADGTLIDIATPLEGRPAHERLAHRFGERYVDATMAVSDYIAAFARRYDRPVEVIHPFIEDRRFSELKKLNPGGDGETVLCIGKYRHKNGQDILLEAMNEVSENITTHFIGPDTDEISSQKGVEGHGFVELSQFYDLLDDASLMVFPARVGAYPVAVLEALVSGTAVITSPYVGNADLVRAVNPGFVTKPKPNAVAEGICWAMNRDLEEDGRRAREIGNAFQEKHYIDDFVKRFNKVLSRVRTNR
ncbi:MAG: glycosyltransferase family 4 protein [Halopenitus sp.]